MPKIDITIDITDPNRWYPPPMTQTRAPKGSGSLYQTTLRGVKVWYATTEIDAQDGKRRRITGTGQTAKQALDRRNTNLKKFYEGQHRKSRTAAAPTVEQYVEKYLTHKKATLKPESYRKVQRDFENHILPALGTTKLNELNEDNLHAHFYTTLKDIGNAAQKNVFKNLSALLNHAITRKVITENPLTLVPRPKAPIQVQDADSKYINERVSLYKGLLRKMVKDNNPHLPIFEFMLLGMRKAELLGLTWSSVNNLTKANKATIVIKQQLKRYEIHEEKTGWYIAPYTKGTDEQPKNRVIYLPETYRKLLLEIKKQQDTTPKTGEWYDDLIFKHNGKQTTYNNLQKIWTDNWRAYLKDDYEAKRFRIHYVRHICASLLSAQGMTIETIQDILGHSDAAISLHYRQQMREQRQQATLTVEKWLNAR